jgi:hypothetical protein
VVADVSKQKYNDQRAPIDRHTQVPGAVLAAARAMRAEVTEAETEKIAALFARYRGSYEVLEEKFH